MTLRAEIKLYNDNKKTNDFELDKELCFKEYTEENSNSKEFLLKGEGMANFEVVGGGNLTSQNIIDLTAISNILSEFFDVNAAVFVNNSIPSAVSLASTLEEAYNKAIDSDPVSTLNAAAGFSKKVEASLALKIASMPLKLIIAPEYDENALSILSENNNITIVKLNTPLKEFKNLPQNNITRTPFGTVCKNFEKSNLDKNSFNIVTKSKPTAEQIEDVVFAWNISKYTHSNSVIIAKDFKTSAIIQGFTSNVNAIEYALDTACENSKDAILVADTPLSSQECIYAATQGRISVIIQPGGSKNDNKLIELANKYNIVMIFTGIDNYKY